MTLQNFKISYVPRGQSLYQCLFSIILFKSSFQKEFKISRHELNELLPCEREISIVLKVS